ncbi:DoxX family protein [Acinetobacter wanghuae]|uniref:DoxX family protein n=1 Tax=Acinetobacter wanghuae TaxID=2662362 RepID=UPI003AF66ED1
MLNPNVVAANILKNPTVHHSLALLARVFLAYIFIVAGWGKIAGYDATVAYMQAMGVPGGLLPLTILVELGGGLTILLGFQTRVMALALAGFSIVTALLFHSGAEDAINLMKNVAIAGGFIALALLGAGRFSIDHVIEK